MGFKFRIKDFMWSELVKLNKLRNNEISFFTIYDTKMKPLHIFFENK